MIRLPPSPTLFPYTTLFRSAVGPAMVIPMEFPTVRARTIDVDRTPRTGNALLAELARPDRKSTRLNSSHMSISYAVFCLTKKIPSRRGQVDQERAVRRWRDD